MGRCVTTCDFFPDLVGGLVCRFLGGERVSMIRNYDERISEIFTEDDAYILY
jgi:hypothetical protein